MVNSRQRHGTSRNRLLLFAILLWVFNGTQPTVVYVHRDNEAILPCRIQDRRRIDPNSTNIRWRSKKETWLTKGTIILRSIKKIKVIQTSTYEWNLQIHHVDRRLEDVYECVNIKDGTVLFRYDLRLLVRPRLDENHSSPSEVTFKEHTRANLACVFSGEPTPKVTWYRWFGVDRTAIGITSQKLVIPNITRYASGMYTCKGENRLHYSEHGINVVVNFEPDVVVQHEKVVMNVTGSPLLSCKVEAMPLQDFYWTDNRGNRIEHKQWKYDILHNTLDDAPVQFKRLRLKNSQWNEKDYGTYRCVAVGESSSVEKRVLLARP